MKNLEKVKSYSGFAFVLLWHAGNMFMLAVSLYMLRTSDRVPLGNILMLPNMLVSGYWFNRAIKGEI